MSNLDRNEKFNWKKIYNVCMFYILISSANSDVQEFYIISFVLTTKFQLE